MLTLFLHLKPSSTDELMLSAVVQKQMEIQLEAPLFMQYEF